MGTSKYLDELDQEERQALERKLWEIQNRKCFICGEPIDLSISKINIDHIRPLVLGGKDDATNFAITHEHCNKSKQDADLEIARRLYQLDRILQQAESQHQAPSLKHVLKEYGGSKYNFSYRIEGDTLIYTFDETGDCKIHKCQIFTDKLSGERTAFLTVPLEYLYHDEIINPRGINRSISLLIKEFYKKNPQLHLTLARIDAGKIRVFDGQHKAVAQIMLDVRSILVRLFIDPDVDRLIETNTTAGTKLKQIAFDKSIVRQLHDTLYAERLRKYQLDHHLQEDDLSFSERDLVDHFKGERGDVKQYIINSQKNAITRSPDNKLQSYINFEGRGTTLPLSYSTFEKTFLSAFINPKTILTTPIGYKVDEGINPRILEKEQAILICNIIAEEILVDRYDDQIGTYRIENKITDGKGKDIPDNHLIACRLCREEIIYNWMKYLKLVITNHLAYVGTMYDNENLLQQKLPDQLWDNIRFFLRTLRALPAWRDRSMSATVFGGKNSYDYWDAIFKTTRAPNGMQVLAAPLNVSDMIAQH